MGRSGEVISWSGVDSCLCCYCCSIIQRQAGRSEQRKRWIVGMYVVEMRGVGRIGVACRVLVGRCGRRKENERRTGPGSAREVWPLVCKSAKQDRLRMQNDGRESNWLAIVECEKKKGKK